MPDTPISRDEQITAIIAYAHEYASTLSISTTLAYVLITNKNMVEASNLTMELRKAGWLNTTVYPGQLNPHWYIRVPINREP